MKIYLRFLCLPLYAAMVLLLASCASGSRHSRAEGACDQVGKISKKDADQIMAVLWFNYSAEARALYYQAYNLAHDRLDQAIRNVHPGDRLAIVMDIDETVLNNSYLHAQMIEKGDAYSNKTWQQWSQRAKATALPGAREFLDYAVSRGVEVFYISNRSQDEYEATRQNLLELFFPMVDDDHLMLQHDHKGKEPNRQQVLKGGYKIVLMMGDNLSDFSTDFNGSTIEGRFGAVDGEEREFGRDFILLPNPMYGDWEGPIENLYPGDARKSKSKLLWDLNHCAKQSQ